MDLFAHILGELQRRWGGNAFDNHDTINTGSGDDVCLNDGVARAADDGARALAIRDYTPPGRLARPFLAVHFAPRSISIWACPAYGRAATEMRTNDEHH